VSSSSELFPALREVQKMQKMQKMHHHPGHHPAVSTWLVIDPREGWLTDSGNRRRTIHHSGDSPTIGTKRLDDESNEGKSIGVKKEKKKKQ